MAQIAYLWCRACDSWRYDVARGRCACCGALTHTALGETHPSANGVTYIGRNADGLHVLAHPDVTVAITRDQVEAMVAHPELHAVGAMVLGEVTA
jgi:hypothetical protein